MINVFSLCERQCIPWFYYKLFLSHLLQLYYKLNGNIHDLQNTLKSVKCLSSSQAFLSVKNQLEKSKSEVSKYQALFEKLQVVTGRYFHFCLFFVPFCKDLVLMLTVPFSV